MTRASFGRSGLVCLALGMLAQEAAAQDLTGIWRDNSGARYVVRQLGENVCWSVDRLPRYANVFCGIRVKQTVFGVWLDLPTGEIKGGGRLVLKVESGSRFVRESSTSTYGGDVWTREGNAPPPIAGNPSPIPDPSPFPTPAPAPAPAPAPPPTRPPDAIALPPTLSWESAGNTRGTWTRRGTSNVFDVVYEAGGGRVTAVEQLSFPGGSQVTSQRLSSSDGVLCTLSGTARTNPWVMEGTGDCANGGRGWYWKLTPGSAASASSSPDALADNWDWESAGGHRGSWTRRGSSGDFDVVYIAPNGNRVSAVERLTRSGNEISIQRLQSADNILCTLRGTLQPGGRVMTGTGSCNNGSSGWDWKLTSR